MPVAEVHERIKAGVVSTIKALDLEDIGARVLDQLWPDPLTGKYPMVHVTTEGEAEEIAGGTTEHKDFIYPVRVFFADLDTAHRHERQGKYLRWRDWVMDAFDGGHKAFMAYVPEVWKIEVVPRVIFDPEAPQYRLVVGSLLLRFWARRRRRAA